MGTFAVGAENGLPIELHYTDQGEGRPVVLIHGWPLSGRSWESQVPALIGAGHRVISYDRRGFGQSSQPWNGYDYDTLAADLAALVDHLDLHDAVLIGFSMGGGEVVRYLSRYGADRVSKIVLASAVPPYLYQADDNPDGGADDDLIESMVAGIKKDRMAFFDGFMDNFFSAGKTMKVSPQQKAYAMSLLAVASPKGTVECVHAFSRTDFRDDLTKVTVPTLVIHGDSDNIVPIEVSGQRTAAAIPGSVLVILEQGPHGILVSHPEEWNAAVLQFLAGEG
ncbi:MAG TPA: alpha/beta hydrolase [Propionibacteriaceae bacterium]|nr:alpha/beta hydrolase [Propionibacteriaceae bacterium]